MSVTVATGLLIGSSIATGVGALGAAKMQSGAAGRAAQLTTDSANRAAELERQTAADQLAYVRNQDRMDRESTRWADEQNYGLFRDKILNEYAQYGDTAYNTRASELSRGRSDDKRYGATQNQLNTMRALMGMPNKELVSYIEPDALRLTAPVISPYVPDPTRDTVDDDTGVDPMTNPNRLA